MTTPLDLSSANKRLCEALTLRYGPAEASSIARIVLEDAFRAKTSVASRPFSADETDLFFQILSRLEAGEPVQYVLGMADFFGYKFMVNPDVLIPRQETEELVALALGFIKKSPHANPRVLDIGLGSGCIGLTLKAKQPNIELWGLEKSSTALIVARENARRLGLLADVDLRQGDVFDAQSWAVIPDLDVIVSNPPYIPVRERILMPEHVLAHEPELALFVPDEDPLLFYRVIADMAREKLRGGGVLMFECNEFNAKEVFGLLQQKAFKQVCLQQDLSGADRVVWGGQA